MREKQIRCPNCAYRPRLGDRWSCVPRCGTLFDTFATGGRCPGCGHLWLETQCPACARWSPHEDWYVDPQADRVMVPARADASPGLPLTP